MILTPLYESLIVRELESNPHFLFTDILKHFELHNGIDQDFFIVEYVDERKNESFAAVIIGNEDGQIYIARQDLALDEVIYYDEETDEILTKNEVFESFIKSGQDKEESFNDYLYNSTDYNGRLAWIY